jgi:hypothetical protein
MALYDRIRSRKQVDSKKVEAEQELLELTQKIRAELLVEVQRTQWDGSWNPHKECVTTHLQNHTAPKTDGAQAVGKFLLLKTQLCTLDCPTLGHLTCMLRTICLNE